MIKKKMKNSFGARQNRISSRKNAKTKRVTGGRSLKQRLVNFSELYKTPLTATRSGVLFSAFPYPTKISPETIALFIATHTKPGDTVFDGFAGSGTTGIAALLCGRPTQKMKDQASKLHLKVKWGARRAVLRDIGTLGSFVGRTLCNPPSPTEFLREAERILTEAKKELGWMYEASDQKGEIGELRYIIWSEVLKCPNCGQPATFWDGCVHRQPARIDSVFVCPHCSRRTASSEVRRLSHGTNDELLGRKVTARLRKPVRVFGTTRGKDWSRPVQASDKALLRRIAKAELSPNIPLIEVPWGDLYRSGYHQGISHLHHFYTKRNLAIFAKLWQLSEASPVRDAIRFWLLSYNASHATIMTRVVAKKNQNELVLTSSQSGVLYVSGLPVEKNLFSGLRRKLKTIHAAFTELQGLGGMVDVQQGSCLFTGLPEKSIDYVFTDPPFGGNIPYGEVNFLNEAWLGACTNTKDEVTISRAQEKTVFDYEALMAQALLEVRRILRQRGNATVVFHSSSAEVWNTLQKAYRSAGFKVELASVLDKVQGSFKQVTADGAVKGDPILLLGKAQMKTRNSNRAISPVVDELIRRARASSDPAEQTPQRLYSRFVNHYLTNEQTIPLDASQFYQLISLDSQ